MLLKVKNSITEAAKFAWARLQSGRMMHIPGVVGGRAINCFAVKRGFKRRGLLYVPTLAIVCGANVICDDGEDYYAAKGAGGSLWSVGGMRLGTSNTAPTETDIDVTTFLAGSGKVIDATYPMTNDTDPDNPGTQVPEMVTWRVSYTTSEANGTGIYEMAIVDNITTPTKALCHTIFGASFNKTSSDTLKVFANHSFS